MFKTRFKPETPDTIQTTADPTPELNSPYINAPNLIELRNVEKEYRTGEGLFRALKGVLAQHIRQIGMMKSIGANSGELVPMYLGMVLAFGVLSLLIALPLGVLGAQAFVAYLGETLLNLRIGNAWPSAQVIGLQAIIGLLAPVLAALAPIFSGTRKTVHQALNDYGWGGDNAKRMTARPPSAFGNLLSRPMRLALRHPQIPPC